MDHPNDNYFQVSVKGLFFDVDNRLMMIQDKYGLWDLPGGRIQKGEEFAESLQRECEEEMGLSCEIVDTQPSIVYPAIDKEGRGRIMVFYKINFKSLDFRSSDECSNLQFFSKNDIRGLALYPQLNLLLGYL